MSDAASDRQPHSLMWYSTPPAEWMAGLPIGNGALAAMICGSTTRDRVALNHEWLWRGEGRGRDVEPAHQHLAKVRKLFFAGKILEAGQLAQDVYGGGGGMSDRPCRVDAFQPAGDLFIELEGDAGYRRELDLDRAVATVSGGGVTREYIAHSTLPVIAIRLTSDRPFKANLSLRRITDRDCSITPDACDETIGMSCEFKEGIRFAIAAKVLADGKVVPGSIEQTSVSTEASDVLIILSIAVDLEGEDPAHTCRKQIDWAPRKWDKLIGEHVDEHRKLYRRVRIDVGDDVVNKPTDQRLSAVRNGAADVGLITLYHNLGRYLLIASSRPGGLPANLQGMWNEELNPPWDSDLHQDINIQMNYWPAEPCGLVECVDPLFDHIERFIPHGREAARKLYDCGGVWYPIQTDPWGRATPESYGWAVWIGAAAWLAQHMWWRYEYSLDADFLRTRAYPFFKEVAAFYEDYLVPHPEKGWLVAVPSQSPENRFVGGTEPVSLCISATMDIELIHDLLTHAIAASEILGVDAKLRDTWRDILATQPPLQIGRHGQLQEWLEDYDEVEPSHRHISHLFALCPGDQLTYEAEPELTQAARVSLERRLASGGGHTGWSRAWTCCCWARLGEGDLAYEHLIHLIADFATDSLLDLHPPRIFQIEGNLGGAACVCEMLMQSHGGIIRILPSLPTAWPEGSVDGLRARGGFIVDIDWAGGRPTAVTIHSTLGGPCRVKCPGAATLTGNGAAVDFEIESDDTIRFSTAKNTAYELTW